MSNLVTGTAIVALGDVLAQVVEAKMQPHAPHSTPDGTPPRSKARRLVDAGGHADSEGVKHRVLFVCLFFG
jgi:hypothetical protein